MSKQTRAVLTIIAGTIGVGFLALPYSIYHFGTFTGIIVLIIVGMLTIVTNIAYGDIITSDKGNRQIPGYVRKYLGDFPAHITTFFIITGYLGILLAYGIIAGSALRLLLFQIGVKLSASFLGLIFAISALFLTKYGMKIIAKVSSWAVIALILAIIILLVVSLPEVDFSNITSINLSSFSALFGVSIFAMYSAGSIPNIDEIIGYNKRKYRKAIIISNVLTIVIYVFFTLILSLSIGSKLTDELINSFTAKHLFASKLMSILTLLAVFTSFVSVSNNIKEVLTYDYKMPARVSTFLISSVLVWFLAFEVFDFGQLLSKVGNFALALQSLAIFAVWFKSQTNTSVFYKTIVGICSVVLLFGMLSQI